MQGTVRLTGDSAESVRHARGRVNSEAATRWLKAAYIGGLQVYCADAGRGRRRSGHAQTGSNEPRWSGGRYCRKAASAEPACVRAGIALRGAWRCGWTCWTGSRKTSRGAGMARGRGSGFCSTAAGCTRAFIAQYRRGGTRGAARSAGRRCMSMWGRAERARGSFGRRCERAGESTTVRKGLCSTASPSATDGANARGLQGSVAAADRQEARATPFRQPPPSVSGLFSPSPSDGAGVSGSGAAPLATR